MKKLLIIETEHDGHYLTGYIKYILRSLKKKNIKVFMLLSDKTLKHGKGALKILKDEGVKYHIETIKLISVNKTDFLSLIINQLKLYFLIKKKFYQINEKFKFDHVILTSIQRIDKIISILGSPFGQTNFSAVFLGLKFHLKNFKIKSKSTNHFLSKLLFNRLLNIKTLSKIIVNDYLLKKFVDKKFIKNKEKVLFLHDPKEFNFKINNSAALKKLKIPKNKFVILIYGAIIDSKGVEELLDIYRHYDNNVHCLIVGKQFGLVKNFLKENKFIKQLLHEKKISIFDGWQSEKKEAIFFNASNMIWIGYKNYTFPSGVLYQAVALNKPCIISNNGFINELNKKYKIGYATNINDYKSIINSIEKIKSPENLKILKRNIKKFFKISNPAIWTTKFRNNFLKII